MDLKVNIVLVFKFFRAKYPLTHDMPRLNLDPFSADTKSSVNNLRSQIADRSDH
jgi:hypothetical protein